MGLTFGRVFGTDIRAHWSWVLVLAFISVMFGVDLSDGTAASWPPALAWGSSISVAALVFASVTAHELGHVKVARDSGQQIPVAVVQLLGGPYVMEAKPKTAREELRLALAGSTVSLVLAAAFGLVAVFLGYGPVNIERAPDWVAAVGFVTTMVASFNVLLGLINLVPGYPLDGARIVHALVWQRTGQDSVANAAAARVGRYVGYAAMLAGIVGLIVDPLAGLCLVVAGWLMIGSSRLLDRRGAVQEMIAGLLVRDAEDPNPGRVPPQLTLDVFAGEYLGERLGAAALVERGTELLGLIGTSQIRRIPRRRWTDTRTEQAMVPIAAVPRVSGDMDLWSALETLERTGLDALLVASGGDGNALVSRRSVAKLVHERAQERQRQMIADGGSGKGRFRGR